MVATQCCGVTRNSSSNSSNSWFSNDLSESFSRPPDAGSIFDAKGGSLLLKPIDTGSRVGCEAREFRERLRLSFPCDRHTLHGVLCNVPCRTVPRLHLRHVPTGSQDLSHHSKKAGYSVTGCGTDFLQWKWAEMNRAVGEVAA